MKTPGKIVLIFTLMALPFVMVRCTTLAERQTKLGGSPTLITHSFASKEVSHGDPWKVYLEANDPDGDMQNFVYTISRAGTGHRVKYMRIKKGERARLLGYLSVFFSSPQTAEAERANLTLTLHIRDRGGNPSNKVIFPVALSRGVKQAPPPPPFDVGGLKGSGTIWHKFKVPLGD